MSRQPESIGEWIDHYTKLRDRNYQNYQDSGEAKYDRACEKYDVIIDGLIALEEKRSGRKDEINKRFTNMNGVVERICYKDTFTLGEVKKLLYDAVYW